MSFRILRNNLQKSHFFPKQDSYKNQNVPALFFPVAKELTEKAKFHLIPHQYNM